MSTDFVRTFGRAAGTHTRGSRAPMLPPAFRPFDKLRDHRLKDLPPKFVELVETNPEVTSTFAPHPRPFDRLRDQAQRVASPGPAR